MIREIGTTKDTFQVIESVYSIRFPGGKTVGYGCKQVVSSLWDQALRTSYG